MAEGNLFHPGLTGRKSAQFCFDAFHQFFQGLVEAQILLHTKFLRSRKLKGEPPLTLVRGKRFAWGQNQIATMQNRVETVSRLGPLLDESLAVCDQSTQFTNGVRRNPNRRDEIGG